MNRNLKEFVNQSAGNRMVGDVVGPAHVAILLGLFNGARHLSEQLESLTSQTHRDWSLIISDDGSRDAWLEVLADFRLSNAERRTWVMNGPRAGFAENFLTLVQAVGPTVPFAAFCDQDDVWRSDKLTAALQALATLPPGCPGVYCGRTVVTDGNLRPTGTSPLFRAPPSFRNALVQSIAGGNTMVLNRAALDLLQDTRRRARGVVSHDWWVYQLITGAGGRVLYDQEPRVFYRQHGQNRIGSNTGVRASGQRLRMLLEGRFRAWNDANIRALESVAHWLTDDAKSALADFSTARNGSLPKRIAALYRSGIFRQTKKGTCALWLAMLLKRL
ncbi:MAG: glycosyltransferase [Paracoccaceae bacterium]|nr:glycosyltransferase [Paracoccaceae bacterium]